MLEEDKNIIIDFQDILCNIHEGITISDIDLNFVFANNVAEKIFHVGKGELAGKNLGDFVVKEDYLRTKTDISRELDKDNRCYDLLLKKSSGEERVINLSVSKHSTRGKIYVLGICRDVTNKRMNEKNISFMAFHDSLTGAYNRAFFEQEVKRLDTDRQMPLTVIMIDVNDMKLINDNYGHDFGDKVLRYTAKIIKKSCRTEDIVARFGGDEFVVLLPQTLKEEAMLIQSRIENIINKTTLEGVPISLAIGVASKYSQKERFSDVLKKADRRMYEHKQNFSRRFSY